MNLIESKYTYLALDQVDQQTHYLIADILNRKLPLANCRDKKIFNPEDDADYRTLGAEYENDFGNDLPNQKEASQAIAYEYLFLVVKDKPKKKKITKSVISKKTKKPTNLPAIRNAKVHSKKTKQNPVEYYNCLLTQAQNN
ncbi:1493_t:CDS:2 [Funneliformis geosporum]|uniref:1493_t:CDS:1 n=1 Tax=Funneliformis geosporum TaxID=1117311 RepID=A0A9W4SI58_9GLOM|nr:1493_t:CDS:2 [Funneliformis geosporum]